MWQPALPLPPAWGSGSWSFLSFDPQSEGKIRYRDFQHLDRFAEGAAGGRRVPSLPSTQSRFAGSEREDLQTATCGGYADAAGKKTAEAIQQEVAQEVNRILQIVFGDWHKTGSIDLEPLEMLVRESIHRAGAVTIQRLLGMPGSPARHVPCGCGPQAR